MRIVQKLCSFYSFKDKKPYLRKKVQIANPVTLTNSLKCVDYVYLYNLMQMMFFFCIIAEYIVGIIMQDQWIQ